MNCRPQHVDATRTVDFVVIDGERRVAARISDEALCDCFAGFYGLKDPLVSTYLKNARLIDNAALRKAYQGYAEPILLVAADFSGAVPT